MTENHRIRDVIDIKQTLSHFQRGLVYADDGDTLLFYGNDGYGSPEVDKEIELLMEKLNREDEACPLTTYEGTWVIELSMDGVQDRDRGDVESWARRTLSICWLVACGMMDRRFMNIYPIEEGSDEAIAKFDDRITEIENQLERRRRALGR